MLRSVTTAMTVEEYISSEWTAECRHEYINGQLFEMPGEKDINNEMAQEFCFLLRNLLRPKGYQVYLEDIKVAIPGGHKYYYPDVFATKEPRGEQNQYIKHKPEIIIEVVSKSTHKTDYVDKYIDYTQIPSLQYYIIAEPETLLVTVNERSGEDWITEKYTGRDEVVALLLLGLEIPMSALYPPAL